MIFNYLNRLPKFICFLVFLLVHIFTFAQTVTVDQTMSVSDLVKNVLIGSECADVTNIISRTGVNFNVPGIDNPNGIGFFDFGNLVNPCEDNPSNPFTTGVLLTSGDASRVANNHFTQLSDGQANWPGDPELNAIVNAALPAGTDPLNSINATSIEFDFVATAPDFSFKFFMASEEYSDQFECQFSDAFAFILTDSNGNSENLAVIPGTTTPITVTNIHNEASCPNGPQNAAFFCGEFRPGDTDSIFAFNGFTIPLTAIATVIPGDTYRIKLVVADDGRNTQDTTFDTGVFIQAGSFSGVGSSLPDFTLDSGNPGCGNNNVDLDTGITDPTATFQWFKEDTANPMNPPILIPGATGVFYSVPPTGAFGGNGKYIVVINFGSQSCSAEDDSVVEFVNQPFIADIPQNIEECETDGNQIETFDLTINTPLVLGTQTDVQIEYFDGLGNVIPVPSNYTNATSPETITIRLSNNNSTNGFGTCPVDASFVIGVFNAAEAFSFTYILCDNDDDGDDTNGEVEFNLPSIDTDVLGAQDPLQFSVTYHLTFTDADTDVSPLPNLYTNTTANSQDIFARVQNNNALECYAISTVTLQVNELPTITASVDLLQCDDDTDGLSNFNLTEANELISTNAAMETFTYYTNLADAEAGNNAITNELSYPNTDPSATPDLLFVRVENDDTCYRVAELELFVSTTQIPAGFAIPPYQECDDTRVDDNITDGITVFNFSNATTLIEGVFPVGQNITVSYYENEADALAEINEIPDPSNHINSASPFNQTIFFRIENDTDNSCLGLGDFELETINPTPRTDTESVDLVLCDDVTIGNLSEEFDLTQNEAFIFNGEANLTASYFLAYDDALNDVMTNEITTPATYNNTNSTETIYVRVENTVSTCFAIVDFDITVNPLPNVVPVLTLEACENGTDGIFTFDLDEKRDEILNGQDPSQFNVTFHINQNDADNLNNPQPDMFTNTVNPQEIFFAITNNVTTCSNSTGSFFVEVLEGAQANSDGEPLDYELCDDESNDGSEQFNLVSLQDEVLDGQDPTNYTISYHFTENDALNDVDELPLLYENLTNPQTIWVRVSNNLSPDICFEVQPVPLRVNPSPEFDLDDLYILCLTTNGTEVVPVPPVLDTGLSATDYTFEWSLDNVVLPLETNPSLTPTQGGTYSVIVTDVTTSTLTQCTNMDEAIVLESEIPIVEAEVTSQAFAGNHTVEATTTNIGDFEYSLDLGPWQDNGTFENVTPGSHTVYARDINGCGIGSDTILVIDYPLYFTPNGDGNHDTWNIVGIGTQPSAKIYIFDRYGKLMKQLSPTSPGWDGSYQGNLMPSDDYWFTVEYVEPISGETLQQTAHFTLKR